MLYEKFALDNKNKKIRHFFANHRILNHISTNRNMENIDDLLKQQRNLIMQMDQQHQRQMRSLQDRISRVESEIQLMKINNSNSNSDFPNPTPNSNRDTNFQSNQHTKNTDTQNVKLPQLNPNHPTGSRF